jgi:hypothetical protein
VKKQVVCRMYVYTATATFMNETFLRSCEF